MKRKVLVQRVCSVIFVVVAGFVYLGTAGTSSTKESAQIILQEDEKKESTEETNEMENGKEEVLQQAQELLFVHICGAVNAPGVYRLPEGSRIADAVLCAGDFSENAAKDYLNLAKPVLDGEKIYVPNKDEAEQNLEGKRLQDEKSENGESFSVNLNTVGVDELMKLPGIGQTKAEAILAYRREHGAFSSCEELMQVPGIKQSVYEKIRDNITVGN